MNENMSKTLKLWRGALCLFAVLSLSTMAGMSIGGGIFALASFFAMYMGWPAIKSDFSFGIKAFGWGSLLFFLLALASLVVANFFPPPGEPISGYKELFKFHYFLQPFLVCFCFLATGASLERHVFWKFWGGMACFLGVISLVQFNGGLFFSDEILASRFFRAIGHTGRYHAQGLMFFHLSFASCMGFVAAAGGARVLWPMAKDTKGDRIFWYGIALAGILSSFLTFSRISWIALGALLLLLAYMKRPLLGGVLTVLLALFAVGIWNFSPSIRSRIDDTRRGNFERITVWAGAMEMVRERPVLGMGFGRSGHYSEFYAQRALGAKPEFSSHSHNNFLDILATMGILGFMVFLFWWALLFYMAWKTFRLCPADERWLPAACLAGFFAFHINGLTQVNFWDGKSEHTLMIWAGITLANWVRCKKHQSVRT